MHVLIIFNGRFMFQMHLRFDGTFGFPGGLIKPGEDVVDGLNREMAEEIGWSLTAHPVTWADYYSTQVRRSLQIIPDSEIVSVNSCVFFFLIC